MAKKVLILSPHTDDGELGVGGTVARLIEEGAEIYWVVFSTSEESVPEGYPKDILEKEFLAAMEHLTIPPERVRVYHFPVRHLPAHRQEILEELVMLNRTIAPDIVFAPSLHDVHQDHHTVAEEAVRAFKKTTLLGYEEPWNNLTFDNKVFFTLEERHLDLKAAAMECYESQKFRPYTGSDYLKGLARCHGVQIGKDFAEVFELVRSVL